MILGLTAVSGSIAFLLWKIWAMYMELHRKLRWIYPMLAVVELFFLFPFSYGVLLVWRNVDDRIAMERGFLFWGTDRINMVCTIALLVWAAGGLIYAAVSTVKLCRMNAALLRSCVPAGREIVALADEIRERLGIRENVLIYQSYALQTSLVLNGPRKRIVFPMWEHSRHEVEVILYHELTHVKQKILPLKAVATLIKYVYWFDPLAHFYADELDSWGETACDMSVRFDTGCVEDFHDYFNVVLSGQEKRLEFPEVWTQLRKEEGVVERMRRIRDYERAKDWRIAGGIAVMLAFCLTCTTSVAAATVELGKQYNKVYESTVNVVDLTDTVDDDLVMTVEEWNPETYPYDVIEVPSQGVTRAGGLIGCNVPAYTLLHTPAFYVSGPAAITVSVSCTPPGKTFSMGLLTPDGYKLTVTGTNTLTYTFHTTASGYYSAFVENLSDTTLEANGHYSYYLK